MNMLTRHNKKYTILDFTSVTKLFIEGSNFRNEEIYGRFKSRPGTPDMLVKYDFGNSN